MQRSREFSSARKTVERSLSSSQSKMIRPFEPMSSSSRRLKNKDSSHHDSQNHITVQRESFANALSPKNKLFVEDYTQQQTQTSKFKTISKDHASDSVRSHHSEYMCINCVNQSLSKEKKLKLLAEKNLMDSREQIFLSAFQSTPKHFEKEKEVRDYNKMQINQQERLKKQKAEHKREEEAIYRQKLEIERQKKDQIQTKEKEKKQRWRLQIEQQIQQKEKEKAKQEKYRLQRNARERKQMSEIQQQKMMMQKALKEKEERYREALIEQIKMKQTSAVDSPAVENTFLLESTEQQQEQRKLQLLQQARARDINRKIFLQQKKIKQQELKRSLFQEKEELQRSQYHIKQEMLQRQSHINHQHQQYLHQLTLQMTAKKQKEIQNTLFERSYQHDLIQQKQVNKKQCKDCQRKFPMSYLTKVK